MCRVLPSARVTPLLPRKFSSTPSIHRAHPAVQTGPVRDMLTLRGFNTVSAPEDALIDGGDVMFTGRELFVGMSSRTTDKGVKALQAAFPAVPVHTVKFSSSETLHLKSMMSMGAPDTVIAADTPVATLALSSMLKQAVRAGHTVRLR